MLPPLNLLMRESQVKPGKYGWFGAILAPATQLCWFTTIGGHIRWFLKAKLTFRRTLTNLKSHETSPKIHLCHFLREKVPKKAPNGRIWEYVPNG